MDSIRNYNTSGLSYEERLELYNRTEPIELGAIVYETGFAFGATEPIKVTEENQKQISMCWNSAYFDSFDKAEEVTRRAHDDYSDWQASQWD